MNVNLNLFFKLEPHVITVQGPDARDFLQRLTSANFRKFKRSENGKPQLLRGAFPRANGSSLGLFEAAWTGEGYVFHLVVDAAAAAGLLAHLEALHFGEDLSFQNDTGKFTAIYFSEQIPPAFPQTAWCCPEYLVTPTRWDMTFGLSTDLEAWFSGQRLSFDRPLQEIPAEDWHAFQVLGGRPRWNADLREDQLLLEFPLDEYVHRNKGCYPGQEVLERLYTYGNAAKFAIVLIKDLGDQASRNQGVGASEDAKASGDGGTVNLAVEAAPIELAPAAFVRAFRFSTSIPSSVFPGVFDLAVILRGQVSPEARYIFRDQKEDVFWTADKIYLAHLVATRSEAKSH